MILLMTMRALAVQRWSPFVKQDLAKLASSAKGGVMNQQTRVYPYPLGAGSARPNPKMGAPAPENPLFLGFSVLRGGLRPWSRKGPNHGVGVDPETVNKRGCLLTQTNVNKRAQRQISGSLKGGPRTQINAHKRKKTQTTRTNKVGPERR